MLSNNPPRFVYTNRAKLIETSKCLYVHFFVENNVNKITYRKNKFTPITTEDIVYTANSISDIATYVLTQKIPGAVFTRPGNVAVGVYPPELVREIGPNKVIVSIWIQTTADTMVRWWDKDKGVLK